MYRPSSSFQRQNRVPLSEAATIAPSPSSRHPQQYDRPMPQLHNPQEPGKRDLAVRRRAVVAHATHSTQPARQPATPRARATQPPPTHPGPLPAPDLAQFDALIPSISLDDILSGKPVRTVDNTPSTITTTPSSQGPRPPPPPALLRRAARPWDKPAPPAPPAPAPPPPAAAKQRNAATAPPRQDPAPSPVVPSGNTITSATRSSRTHPTATTSASAAADGKALLPPPQHPSTAHRHQPLQQHDHQQQQQPQRPSVTAAPAGRTAGGAIGPGADGVVGAKTLASASPVAGGASSSSRSGAVSETGSTGSGADWATAPGSGRPASAGGVHATLPSLFARTAPGQGAPAAAAPAPTPPASAVVRSTRVPRGQRVSSREWAVAQDAVRAAQMEATAAAAARAAAAAAAHDYGYEYDDGDGDTDVSGQARGKGWGTAAAQEVSGGVATGVAPAEAGGQGEGTGLDASTLPTSYRQRNTPLWSEDDMVSEPRRLLVVPEAHLRSALDAAAADQRFRGVVTVADGVAPPRASAALAAAADLTPSQLPNYINLSTWRLHAAVLFPDLYDAEWHGCLFDFFFELWPEVGKAHITAGDITAQKVFLSSEAELAAVVAAAVGDEPSPSPSPQPSTRRRRAVELLDHAYHFAKLCAHSRDFAVSSALVVSALDCVDDHDALMEALVKRLPAWLVERVISPLMSRFQPEWVVEEWRAAVAAAFPTHSPCTVAGPQWDRLVEKLEAAQRVHPVSRLGVLHAVLDFDGSWEVEQQQPQPLEEATVEASSGAAPVTATGSPPATASAQDGLPPSGSELAPGSQPISADLQWLQSLLAADDSAAGAEVSSDSSDRGPAMATASPGRARSAAAGSAAAEAAAAANVSGSSSNGNNMTGASPAGVETAAGTRRTRKKATTAPSEDQSSHAGGRKRTGRRKGSGGECE